MQLQNYHNWSSQIHWACLVQIKTQAELERKDTFFLLLLLLFLFFLIKLRDWFVSRGKFAVKSSRNQYSLWVQLHKWIECVKLLIFAGGGRNAIIKNKMFKAPQRLLPATPPPGSIKDKIDLFEQCKCWPSY